MAIGRGKAEGWDLCPRLTWICFPPSPPHPAPRDGENFVAPSSLLGAPRSPALPCKTLVFVDLPKVIIIFLIKPISLIKIYLKLQINLFHQIKLFFSKY